jgi:PHD/YefM family antitoxin component YafN of YafNO toxin-antitoxin module
MINTQSIPAREMARNYKSIIAKVKQTKEPVILSTQDQAEAAIISLEDLEKLKQLKSQQSAQALQKIGDLAQTIKGEAPRDLSQNLDAYTWDE